MRAFTQLFADLDRTSRTQEKVAALEAYFRATAPADAAWALYFLSGQRLKRLVKTTHLRGWVAEMAGLPLWLVEECYEHVGDLGETLALLLPAAPNPQPLPLAQLVEERLLPLAQATTAEQRALLRRTWSEVDTPQCFLWHKLITGNFRVGVSRALVVRALANVATVDPATMAHRLMGEWRPTSHGYQQLLAADTPEDNATRPYPFFLASPIQDPGSALGEAGDWLVEWKWDGIRAQLLHRHGHTTLWSRGEEIITHTFPEVAEAAASLPDGIVLDGELLAWRGEKPLSFAHLQRRLNRRAAHASLQAEVPVVFMAYDLLEQDGHDCRSRPLAERRVQLESLLERVQSLDRSAPRRAPRMVQPDLFLAEPIPAPRLYLRISPLLAIHSWDELAGLQAAARVGGTEGLMLKRRDSSYGTGRQRGAWWKWKVSPFTCDAVLVAAQMGHGRRATLFTDYTFALWQADELVPVAKAYSGLTDEEIDAVDAFVRSHTVQRFGPVRAVKPELVFELAFEGIARSPRHKSGFALRFPRILRWRRDKKPADADPVDALRELIP
jgi:DNA ligase 1